MLPEDENGRYIEVYRCDSPFYPICNAYHYDEGRCPDCGAGRYWQSPIDTNPEAIEADKKAEQQECKRYFRRALKRANQETLEWMYQKIQEYPLPSK